MSIDIEQARSIFVEAVAKLTPAEWSAFVSERCRGDDALNQHIAKLLSLHLQSGSFLEPPAVGDSSETLGMALETLQPGARIGPYKLLELIGEGGFGIVFLAEQCEPVRRQVALKVIKPGMDTRQVIARFEAERQALAIMDHPNIAKVFDGGMTPPAHAGGSQRSYFVMELVKGVPITDFCDQNHRDIRERLAMFVSVCQAVQHAHQKGIIHRDLKPSNILVTNNVGGAHCDPHLAARSGAATFQVKIIDFGIAKAIGQQLTDKLVSTGVDQMLGTPMYMSPEQTQGGVDIDTRTDIYSLGVLLYELLTGTTPFNQEQLKKASFDEIRRIIREDEPARPSTRISTLGQAADTVSANRGSDVVRLGRSIRGELDWIVMKALEKDRNRRYETAAAFAADIDCFLNDEPVQACPPTLGYRLGKFARRNKGALAAAGLALAVMVLVGGGAGWALREHAGRRMETERLAEGALGDATALYDQGRWPEALAAALRAQAALDAGVAPAGLRDSVTESVADYQMLATLEEIQVIQAGESEPQSRGFDRQADAEYAAAFRGYGIDVDALPDGEAADRIRMHAVRRELAAAVDHWAIIRRGSPNPSGKDAESLLAVSRAADSDDDWRNRLRDAAIHRDRKTIDDLVATVKVDQLPPITLSLLASTLANSGRPDEATKLLREARRIHPGNFRLAAELAHWLFRTNPPNDDECIRVYTVAAALRPTASRVHFNLGVLWTRKGVPDEAVAAYRAAIGSRPDYAEARTNLGELLRQQGRLDEAVSELRRAVAINSKLPQARNNLGVALGEKGDLDGAIAELRCAISLSPDDPVAHLNLATVLLKKRLPDAAVTAAREAVRLKPDHPEAQNNLGWALEARGAAEDAIKAFREAIRLKSDHARAHTGLGKALSARRRFDEAIAAHREAIRLNPRDAMAFNCLGNALTEKGAPDEAIPAYREAIRLNPREADYHSNLGVALRLKGLFAESAKSCRTALAIDPALPEAHHNLGRALAESGALAEAIPPYREAVRQRPQHSTFLFFLGDALRQTGAYREAIASIEEAVRVRPGYANAHCALARLLATCPDPELRDLDRAVASVKRAVELAPRLRSCWTALGIAHYRVGDWESARQAFEQPTTSERNADDGFFYAMALWKLGKKDEARHMFEQADMWMKKHKPNDVELRLFRAEAAELLGQTEPPTSKDEKSSEFKRD